MLAPTTLQSCQSVPFGRLRYRDLRNKKNTLGSALTITGSVLHFSVSYARCPSHLSVYHRPRNEPQNVGLAQATQLSTTLNLLDLLTSWTEHVQGEEEQRQRAQRGCAHSPSKVEENDTIVQSGKDGT